MYQWLYSNNPYTRYPLYALAIFGVVFVAVFVWAYWPRGAHRFDGAAGLPLEGDNE